VANDRLYSGSVDGTLKIWSTDGLKADDSKPKTMNSGNFVKSDPNTTTSMANVARSATSNEKRSEVDSGIDEREYRQRMQDMV